jgi:type I restriction enzyme S subunit
LEKLPIILPSLNEQQKIASILSHVDELIRKQKTNKSILENLKKSLMQQLLTGKIRVKD